MPRDLTAALRAAMASENPSEIVVFCIEINHPQILADLGVPLRLTSNGVPVTADGILYTPYAFRVTLADDDADQLPVVSLDLDAIGLSQTLIAELRALSSAPMVTVRLASFTDDPTAAVIELEQLPFRWASVEGTATRLSGELRLDEDFLDQIVPGFSFIPSDGFDDVLP